jgi:hypothetical protein
MVRVEQTDLESVNVRRVGRLQICDVDEVKIERLVLKIDPFRLEPRLILRTTKMCQSEIVAVQMVNAGHGRRFFRDQIFDQGGAVAGDVVDCIHPIAASASAGPLGCPLPIPGQRFHLLERFGGIAVAGLGEMRPREANNESNGSIHDCAGYSVRNASIGFTWVARRAGNHVAMSAATARTSGAIVKAIGSSAPT